MLKAIVKKILSHPFLAAPKIEIARFILNNNNSPQLLKNMVFKSRNYLPRKKIKANISLDSRMEAVFELDLNSYGDREIFYGTYESYLVAFYKRVLQSKKVVWDIGSNIGFYAVMAGKVLKGRGEVFAFEPVPVNFNSLKTNISLNNLTNVTPFNVALSSEDGEAEIYLFDTEKITSSPTLNKEWAVQSKLNKRIVIKTRNPMSLLSTGEVRIPDIIKIDSETHEPVILGSVFPLLTGENPPDIISEIMPPTIEPMRELLIEECGYNCYHIFSGGIAKVQELKMRRPYNDYFFTKQPVHPLL